jgi:fido (protein-threonine AMPylation protein)
MATPKEKLASSLALLAALQQTGRSIVRSSDLTRTHLGRLVATGYLQPVVKGWYMPAKPGEQAGETTAWFASMKGFVRGYCDERFGEDWYVNAELSLQLHTGVTICPNQMQVHSPVGKNNSLALPAGTSLFDYQAKDFAPPEYRTEAQGLRALSLELALVRAAPNVWHTDPQTMRLALGQLREVSALSRILLDGGNSVVAGRLAGGLQATGRSDFADEILLNMRSAGYVVVVHDPFLVPVQPLLQRVESPYCGRLRLMWQQMREEVLKTWTVPIGKPVGAKAYLADADERYVADAYHSLSIEGYQVTPELIEKVRTGGWKPEHSQADKDDRNAMAARGYYEAHRAVRKSLEEILAGGNLGDVLRRHLQAWYRAMWAPSVQAGLLRASDLAGWRAGQVFIRNSMHVPLPPEAVRDAMPLFFELMAQETEPAVQAVLGHFVFVFIHPYMDGNGRLARFILNAALARGGWPWTVVTRESRRRYMAALEAASGHQNIKPFSKVISQLLTEQMAHPLERPR